MGVKMLFIYIRLPIPPTAASPSFCLIPVVTIFIKDLPITPRFSPRSIRGCIVDWHGQHIIVETEKTTAT